MPSGPRPKPTALKLIQGNPGKRALNKDEPKPKCIKFPSPPIELDANAHIEWVRVVDELRALGMVTKLDFAVLSAYCVAYSRFKVASESLNRIADKDPMFSGLLIKTKQGNWIQNPLLGVVRRASLDMVRFAAELGMTPSSRSRIYIESAHGADDWE